MTHHCYDVIITHQKFKIDKRQTYLEMLSPLSLIIVTPGAQRAPPADIKCPPAAKRKQAKRACLYKIRTY